MTALGPVLGTLVGGRYVDSAEGEADIDPAAMIQAILSKSIRNAYNLNNIEIINKQIDVKHDDFGELKKRFKNNVVLGNKTTNWVLVYLPLNWNHYRLMYNVTSTLSDPGNAEILWRESCHYVEPSKTASTIDELTENNSALFKRKLRIAAEECSRQLVEQFK